MRTELDQADVDRIAGAAAAAVLRELRPQLLDAIAAALAPTKAEPRYLPVPAFAELVGVSRRTAQHWVARGLPVVRPSARVVRVDVAAARAWLDAGGPGAALLESARRNAAKASAAAAARPRLKRIA